MRVKWSTRLIRSERCPVSSQSKCRKGESHGRGTQHVMSYFSGERALRNTLHLSGCGDHVIDIQIFYYDMQFYMAKYYMYLIPENIQNKLVGGNKCKCFARNKCSVQEMNTSIFLDRPDLRSLLVRSAEPRDCSPLSVLGSSVLCKGLFSFARPVSFPPLPFLFDLLACV